MSGFGERVRGWIMRPEGRRRVAAVTGLLLCGFLVIHLAWLLVMWQGAEAFDGMAGAVRRNPAVRVLEIALSVVFAVHLVISFGVVADERRADPAARRVRATRSMAVTGALLAVFLVWHLTAFRFGIRPDAFGALDFHGTVLHELRHPVRALAYCAMSLVLAWHVAVGLRASLDEFRPPAGGRSPAHAAIAGTFALLVLGGYGAITLWAWLA